MALVYNSIEIPYGSSVGQSISVPLYPRLRRTRKIVYNVKGLVAKSIPVEYDIIDYLPVSQSVEITYGDRLQVSKVIPYAQEQRVLQSIAIEYSGLNRVFKSSEVRVSIPGYTYVFNTNRVLCRFEDQTFIQPSVTLRVTITG